MKNYSTLTPLLKTRTPPFDPTQLTGKLGIWIADAANVTLSGSNVTAWADLSGNSNTATPGTNQPTFVASGLNGQGVINFNNPGSGAGQSFTFPNNNWFSPTRGTSIYMVVKNVFSYPANTKPESFLFTGQMGTSGGYPALIQYHQTGPNFDGFILTGLSSDIPTPLNFATSVSTTNYHIIDFEHDATGYTATSGAAFYFDRSLISTGTSITFRDYGNANNIAGYDVAGISGYELNGQIAALIVLDHALSSIERTHLNNWVANKYGI